MHYEFNYNFYGYNIQCDDKLIVSRYCTISFKKSEVMYLSKLPFLKKNIFKNMLFEWIKLINFNK